MFAAMRIHADDTPVPVLAKGKTRTGRVWTYVRDDRPFGGTDPPATVFFYSADRGGAHAERHLAGWSGLMQADAYAGFGRLYEPARKPGPIVEAACWAARAAQALRPGARRRSRSRRSPASMRCSPSRRNASFSGSRSPQTTSTCRLLRRV
jgi:hypothetical protein